ncbi:hypothetical protein BJY24_005601 [Nocardia transvalensis]|uniref:Pyridoxamine 5'-phosphate oxidase-like protein n=1 Tax=Nocardia transvalensis TaxID=37333 RepID=A0A7W9PIA8_9NOCA|nr:pyridoxamine 5'-phosphate oxidase family protein [Nocardia transvalensis]MBB5916689.1 hypothetical protein [Nocardia transvalensis]
MTDAIATRHLTTVEALALLGSVHFGRVVYSRYALPTIRPVNHIVTDGTIVIATGLAPTLTCDRQVVAYEADTIDHISHTGWCVIVTGAAAGITDPGGLVDHRLPAQVLPGPRGHLMRIEPDIVTGVGYIDSRNGILQFHPPAGLRPARPGH